MRQKIEIKKASDLLSEEIGAKSFKRFEKIITKFPSKRCPSIFALMQKIWNDDKFSDRDVFFMLPVSVQYGNRVSKKNKIAKLLDMFD